MTLLAPLGLLALLALPVIVILHLIQSRRRRVEVPSLLLWQQLPLQPIARRRRRLRLTLLLFLHLLAAFLIGMALAQPHITWPWLSSPRNLAIIIDTSTSMALVEDGGSRLDQARQKATTLIGQMRGSDQVILISAGPQARLIDRGQVADRERLLAALAALRIEGAGSDVTGALTIAETFLIDQAGGEVVLLTDGALPPPDFTGARLPIRVEVLGTVQANRAVVTLAVQPGSANEVHIYARLLNAGDRFFRGPVRLWLDDQNSLTETVTMQAGATLELTWTLPGPARQVRLEIAGNDGLPLDDTATVVMNNQQPVRVLLVGSDVEALTRALQAMPDVTLTTISSATYNPDQAPLADVTVLVNTLPSRWPEGGVLVINPPAGSLLAVQGRALAEATVTLTPAGETLLHDINLSGVNWGSVVLGNPPDWLTPLAFSGNHPLILRGRFERSDVAVWNFDLTDHPITRRLAFPLLVARTIRDLAPPALPTAMTLGTPLIYATDLRTTDLEVRHPAGDRDVMAIQPVLPVALEPSQAGLYQVRELSGRQVLREAQIPVNAGSLIESDVTPRIDNIAVGPTFAPMPATRTPVSQPVWSWLVIAAIGILVAEWLYIQRRPIQEGR
ncbi:VWA domain-containing protein [Chloroflexus sp.]|uniref:VWA domain-containing protein n=1 Tax=Chloroflexus sp. TaxID=1904827 RepID=UPI002ADD40B7|nr:VWA domain-containing protein [Chloroflexus sp.]